MAHDLFKAIDIYMKRNEITRIEEGVVTASLPNGAQVRVSGSSQTQFVQLSKGSEVDVGDRVVLVRPARRQQWVIVGAFSGQQKGESVSGEPVATFELHPPDVISTTSSVAGSAMVTWNVPTQQPVAIEVQTNSSAIEAGAVVALLTRGSYAIIPTDIDIYVRLRTISNNGLISSFTDWLSLSPASSISSFDPSVDGYWSEYEFPYRLMHGSYVSKEN
jgi:hypothetical protein